MLETRILKQAARHFLWGGCLGTTLYMADTFISVPLIVWLPELQMGVFSGDLLILAGLGTAIIARY